MPPAATHPLPRPAAGVPSDWIVRWLEALVPTRSPEQGPGGPPARVLDLACGRGRHARLLAARGAHVTAVDRDEGALADLRRAAAEQGLASDAIDCRPADLEAPGDWPLAGERYDAVVVTNYLWRPRFDDVLALVAPGGRLAWETFAAGQETLGRPSRPEFLLQPGELISRLAHGWRIVAYEDLRLDDPDRFVQRVLARREHPSTAG